MVTYSIRQDLGFLISSAFGPRCIFWIHGEVSFCLYQPACDPIHPLVAEYLQHWVVLRHLGHHFAELGLSALPQPLICTITREHVRVGGREGLLWTSGASTLGQAEEFSLVLLKLAQLVQRLLSSRLTLFVERFVHFRVMCGLEQMRDPLEALVFVFGPETLHSLRRQGGDLSRSVLWQV